MDRHLRARALRRFPAAVHPVGRCRHRSWIVPGFGPPGRQRSAADGCRPQYHGRGKRPGRVVRPRGTGPGEEECKYLSDRIYESRCSWKGFPKPGGGRQPADGGPCKTGSRSHVQPGPGHAGRRQSGSGGSRSLGPQRRLHRLSAACRRGLAGRGRADGPGQQPGGPGNPGASCAAVSERRHDGSRLRCEGSLRTVVRRHACPPQLLQTEEERNRVCNAVRNGSRHLRGLPQRRKSGGGFSGARVVPIQQAPLLPMLRRHQAAYKGEERVPRLSRRGLVVRRAHLWERKPELLRRPACLPREPARQVYGRLHSNGGHGTGQVARYHRRPRRLRQSLPGASDRRTAQPGQRLLASCRGNGPRGARLRCDIRADGAPHGRVRQLGTGPAGGSFAPRIHDLDGRKCRRGPSGRVRL